MPSGLANRFYQANNQKLGHALGAVVGFILSIVGLFFISIDPTSSSLTALGSLQSFPTWFHIIFTIPFVSGLCSNIFGNLGAGIDIFTDNRTLIHAIAHICCRSEIAVDVIQEHPVATASTSIQSSLVHHSQMADRNAERKIEMALSSSVATHHNSFFMETQPRKTGAAASAAEIKTMENQQSSQRINLVD